jgi:hypothetical protein
MTVTPCLSIMARNRNTLCCNMIMDSLGFMDNRDYPSAICRIAPVLKVRAGSVDIPGS